MELIKGFLYNFYTYSVDILPYFLASVIITSILQGFTKLTWLRSLLKKEKTAPIYTGFLGGLLPLCSCSMLPVVNLINSMSKNYAPVLSFLIIAPVISPVTLLLTYGYFGLTMTLIRLTGTLFFAFLFAYLMAILFEKPKGIPLLMGGYQQERSIRLFFYHIKENLIGIGKYLLLGIFIASLIKTFFPMQLVRSIAGSFASYPLMSLVALPIYVCSGEEVPIAKALKDIGFTSGNALVFMLGGTGICMPTIIATLKFLPKGLVFSYLIFWFLFSIIMGIFYDYVFWKFLV